MKISKQYSFDAAHHLNNPKWTDDENRHTFGKCAGQHGHTYTVEVEIEGTVPTNTGMVLNYFQLDDVVKPIVELLDHKDLNNCFDHLTTAELMVSSIARLIEVGLQNHYAGRHVRLSKVVLSETPKTKATWEWRGGHELTN